MNPCALSCPLNFTTFIEKYPFLDSFDFCFLCTYLLASTQTNYLIGNQCCLQYPLFRGGPNIRGLYISLLRSTQTKRYIVKYIIQFPLIFKFSFQICSPNVISAKKNEHTSPRIQTTNFCVALQSNITILNTENGPPY